MPTKRNPILARGLLGAVLLCFLMPFLTLTCGGGKLITMNGINMATGTSISSKDPWSGRVKTEKIQPEILVAVAGLAAIAALGLAFASGRSGQLASMLASSACAASLLLTKFKVEGDVVKQGQGVVGAQWEVGFWLALLGSISAAVVLFMNLRAGAVEAPAGLSEAPAPE